MFRLLSFPRDLLLHLLLHHFTVQEVIQFRCLCHELYDLVHYCLGRRRSLKLFFSFAEVQAFTQLLYEHNLESDPALRLHPRGPSSDELILNQHRFLNPLVDLLVDQLFPNVSHLIIFIDYYILVKKSHNDDIRFISLMCHNVPYLISRLRTQLTGLSLFGTNRIDGIGLTISRRLLRKINKIHNLRRLDLCFMFQKLYSYAKSELHKDNLRSYSIKQKQPLVVLKPKLLKKLERFCVLFMSGHHDRQFCEQSFRHLGPSLTQLVMHQLYADDLCYYIPEPLLSHCLIGPTSSLSTSSITQLKLTQHLSILLPKMLPRFSGLKSLDLVNSTFSREERPMPLSELFGLLAQFCPLLTDLKLSKFKLGWIQEAEALTNVPQLGQITSLVLNVHKISGFHDRKIEPDERNIPFGKVLSTLGHVVPNLERFYLKMVSGYFKFHDDDAPVLNDDPMPRLRMLSIGCYSGAQFTCYHLLAAQYRKRHIRECGEQWNRLTNYWVIHSKDAEGSWAKEVL